MHIRGRYFCLLGAALLASSCGGGDSSSSSSAAGPTLAMISPVTINQDTVAQVPLTVSDSQAPVSSLTITASAADSDLVVPQGLSVQNTSSGLVLSITPLEAATGTTTISVMVADANGGMAQQAFTLTVNAVPVSFTSFVSQVVGTADTDPPLAVNGITLTQDADGGLPASVQALLQ